MATQTIDPICQRIAIITRGEDGTRRHKRITWRPDQVRIARTISIEWRLKLSDLRDDENLRWDLEHVEQRDGFDGPAVEYLMNMVGAPRSLALRHDTRFSIESLSRYASAIWVFKVVPSRFPTSDAPCTGWFVESDNKDVAHGDLPGSVTPSSRSSGSSGPLPSWCWHGQPLYGSTEMSLKLANIAFVFGWREVFKREIKTVIWNWPNTTAAGLVTPVEVLKQEGIHGLASTYLTIVVILACKPRSKDRPHADHLG